MSVPVSPVSAILSISTEWISLLDLLDAISIAPWPHVKK